jgi:hypothetical protein
VYCDQLITRTRELSGLVLDQGIMTHAVCGCCDIHPTVDALYLSMSRPTEDTRCTST